MQASDDRRLAGPDPSLQEQPANAILKALGREGLSVSDLDLVEINEAFAAVGIVSTDKLGVDPEKVKPEASFVDDLNADSLDLVELIMSLEEEFGTEISDEDAEKIRTVQDAVDYIDEHAA